jgi:hypothetical protein
MAAWDPLDPNVVVDTGEERILVSHPAYPYPAEWDEANDGADGLFDIASRYVAALEGPASGQNARIGLPRYWLQDLSGHSTPADRPHLLWVPMNPGGEGDRTCDPRSSFWVERYRPGQKPTPQMRLERTAVLFASLYESPQRKFAFMGGQSIRVIAHVGSEQANGRCPVRITALTSTLPRGFEKRFAILTFNVTAPSIDAIAESILGTFSLQEHEIVDFGVYLEAPASKAKKAPAETLILAKAAPQRNARRDKYSYALTAQLTPNGDLLPMSKRTLIAAAVPPAAANIFEQDPMTKNGPAAFHRLRPHRVPVPFDAERVAKQFPKLKAGGQPNTFLLDDDTVFVTNSRFCDVTPVGPGGDAAKEIPAAVTAPTRTNMCAAVNAYYHGDDFFNLLGSFGILASAYFKFAPPGLWIRYRSGITPGPGKDGNTVNAQVSIIPPTLPVFNDQPIARNAKAARIEERLALADLRLNPRRAPLGVACDPRWHWHEVSHILIAAAIGELEFRFAHSAGDALGAIYFDPDSALATHPAWRGVTFPWVTLPARRHDRAVGRGWGWSGSLYQRDRFFTSPGYCDKRGYWTEQIMSSSLFRLYRAIGGDSGDGKGGPDAAARRVASRHSLLLIAQAIRLLGPAALTPAHTVEDFVQALIDADIGTSKFDARAGGMVRKVIRWAFQQQGLYQAPGTPLPADRPGAAEKADLHIDSLRNPLEGTYTPVDFADAQWHAGINTIWNRLNDDGTAADQPAKANTQNHLRASVRNLGTDKVRNTSVTVYWTPLLNAPAIPLFDKATWQASAAVLHDVPGGGQRVFKLKWTPGGPGQYAVLVEASAAQDRSNIDPFSELPCAQPGTPLNTAQLVAWDNNLGLRVVTVV